MVPVWIAVAAGSHTCLHLQFHPLACFTSSKCSALQNLSCEERKESTDPAVAEHNDTYSHNGRGRIPSSRYGVLQVGEPCALFILVRLARIRAGSTVA